MPFYDNYFARGEISSIGTKIIRREIANRIRLATTLRKKNTLKILELGPGKGYFARAVMELGWEYRAIDGSPAVLNALKAYNIEVIHAFVPPIPQNAGGEYDLVLMEHFIEHMDSPGVARRLIDSICSMLSRDGLIIIVAPDFLAHRENFWECDYTHSFVTSVERLRQLLLDCGLEVCHTGYETLGVESSFFTWLVSELTHILYMVRLPQAISVMLNGSSEKSQKWKNVLLRSCVVVGRKRDAV